MNERRQQDPNDGDLIYRAPSSETMLAAESDPLRAYVGAKNAEYYARQFERFQSGRGSISWNWPAFFISAFWLLYRKMWLNAFLYWFALPTALLVAAGIIAASVDPMTSIVFYYGAYFVLAFIALPMFANRLYYGHAQAKVRHVESLFSSDEQRTARLTKLGGTSNVVLVILPLILVGVIGILAAISIPAYQDYTVRAQVAEGLNLSSDAKRAVAAYYSDTGELPTDNATAGIQPPERISGNFVSSVEIVDGDVVINYGEQAHTIIDGHTLILAPYTETASLLEWECYSLSIAPRHLPAACR